MILDTGICSVFEPINSASAGRMPVWTYRLKFQGWYGTRSFSTTQRFDDSTEQQLVAESIRILQDRRITNHDVVVLANVTTVPSTCSLFEVIRAYHGTDDDSGARITDLDLEAVKR